MKPYRKLYRSGAYVTMEKVNGWYCVRLTSPAGALADKVRCDSYRMALEYRRAFNAQARAAL